MPQGGAIYALLCCVQRYLLTDYHIAAYIGPRTDISLDCRLCPSTGWSPSKICNYYLAVKSSHGDHSRRPTQSQSQFIEIKAISQIKRKLGFWDNIFHSAQDIEDCRKGQEEGGLGQAIVPSEFPTPLAPRRRAPGQKLGIIEIKYDRQMQSESTAVVELEEVRGYGVEGTYEWCGAMNVGRY